MRVNNKQWTRLLETNYMDIVVDDKVQDSDISHIHDYGNYILCTQHLQDCVNCRPPPICLHQRNFIHCI